MACGRLWAHVAGSSGRGRVHVMGYGNLAGGGVGTCGRGWIHVAQCGVMW